MVWVPIFKVYVHLNPVPFGYPWDQICSLLLALNILGPRQNARNVANDIFKCNFSHENVWISHKVSMKFVLKVPINNIPALVQMIAWCRPNDKPLSEPMMVSLLTHICVTRPQWVNTDWLYGIPKRQCNKDSDPESKFHGANRGPTGVLSVPDGPHVDPMNLAIRGGVQQLSTSCDITSLAVRPTDIERSMQTCRKWPLTFGTCDLSW